MDKIELKLIFDVEWSIPVGRINDKIKCRLLKVGDSGYRLTSETLDRE